MKRRLTFILALFLSIPIGVFAMSSTQYEIFWDSVNSGGTEDSTSTNYNLRDTIGEAGTGVGSSANYQLSAGYRAGDTQEPFLALDIGTQENQTRTTWSSFSDAGNTVILGSVTGYATGSFIGIVENEGSTQLIAVGKITAIGGLTVTVDDWDGEPGALSGTPAGGDDFAYRLDGSEARMRVQMGQVGTSLTVTDILSNIATGYSVSVQSDGGLREATGQEIHPVSDGAVTAGAEEYGAESVGIMAANPGGDFALSSTSTLDVQESISFGDHDRIGVVYKLSVDGGTPAGSFRQTISYRLTPNY